MFKAFVISLFLCNFKTDATDDYVQIKSSSNGSAVVVGGKINFTATLMKNEHLSKNGPFQFLWYDNGDPRQTLEVVVKKPISNWTVTYSHKHSPGQYTVTVIVKRNFAFWYEVARGHITYNITDSLNGMMSLIQNGSERSGAFVSNVVPVIHQISINQSDREFLENNATQVTTYWFQNCSYVGRTNNYTYSNFYLEDNEEYEIEALVVADFKKLPIPGVPEFDKTSLTTDNERLPSTVSFQAITTSIPEVFNIKSTKPVSSSYITFPELTTTSLNENNETESTKVLHSLFQYAHNNRIKRNPDTLLTTDSGYLFSEFEALSYEKNGSSDKDILITDQRTHKLRMNSMVSKNNLKYPSDSCINKSVIAGDPNNTYGYFRRKIIVKAPPSNLTIKGNNWLQRGDGLQLDVTCSGSPPFEYCVEFFKGQKNITGNETCTFWKSINKCDFNYVRYFLTTEMRTIIVIVRNQVSKIVNQVAVNFYEVNNNSQLSVVVVPVSCSFIAVILIVFGVAYHIQNRNRYIIEVADFNFGDTQSIDMEYKTFRQRLLDSIIEVFYTRTPNTNLESTTNAGESSLKYGSMT